MDTQVIRYFDNVAAEAIAPWLAARHAEEPRGGVIALLAEADKEYLPELQDVCRAIGVPLAGAIFPALLYDNRFIPRGLLLLGMAHMPRVALVDALGGLSASTIAAAVEPLLPVCRDDACSTLFMIFDSMVPNIASLLDELYLRLADRVRYMGINAGSETFQPMPCLFDGERVTGNGVLCLLLDDHPGAVLEHGFVAPAETMTATATVGNRIITIDWRPAFDVYREIVRARLGVKLTQQNFYEHISHFPLGILLANNDVLVRIPVAVQEDGSVFCVGEIPANALLVLLEAPSPGSTKSAEQLAGKLAKIVRPSDDSVLAFYCAGRRMHLGLAAEEELATLQSATGGHALVGALSLGEIGSTGRYDYPRFHNATLVCCPWHGK